LRVFTRIRKEFPELNEIVYLNSAAISLMPIRAKVALSGCLKERQYNGELRTKLRMEREISTRKKIAQLINASYKEICLVSNTSEGLNIVAQGLDLKKGDNVVLTEVEFPGNVIPWLNLVKNGVEIKKARAKYGKDPTENIFEAIDKRTKVLTISFVGWIDGFKFNLEEIGNFCHNKNIVFVVDAIQGTGSMKLDVNASKISFLASGGFKWLLSPNGTGFIYVNKNILPNICPKYVGYLSQVYDPDAFDFRIRLKKDASRFRIGSISDNGIAAMEKSVELILEVGIENIQGHILSLCNYAVEGLANKGYTIISELNSEKRSGILTFVGKKIKEKYINLIKKKIIVALRNDWIRLSPHIYNNQDDIEKMLIEL
jgi:selenocysteine lyase/cysteine desulfurase